MTDSNDSESGREKSKLIITRATFLLVREVLKDERKGGAVTIDNAISATIRAAARLAAMEKGVQG